MNDLFQQIAAGSSEANQLTAMAQGTDATDYNVTGPNAERMTGTFRPASPIEQIQADKEMTLHGYKDGTIQILLIPRAQFLGGVDQALGWRGRKLAQRAPIVQQCIVSQVVTEDAHFFSFVLLSQQRPRNG